MGGAASIATTRAKAANTVSTKDELARENLAKLKVIERHEADIEQQEREWCVIALAGRRPGESFLLRWVARAGLYEVRNVEQFDALSRREFAGINRLR